MNHKEYIIPIGEEAKEFDEMFIGVIRKQPELIRCKDCKYFVDEEDQSYCIEMYGQCSGNGFCAWAERKEK